MVKPQSSKLITRVRFPSSPRTIPPTLSGGFFVLGMPGIAYGRKYIPSRARDFHPPARHPLHITGHTAHSLSSQVLEGNRDRFIAQLPDGSEDATAFHHAQALLARLDANLGASSFDDVYASSANNETQCREAFRTIFEARVQIQHFEVMTLPKEAIPDKMTDRPTSTFHPNPNKHRSTEE